MADKFLDFIDMIDGGGYGEGKMGDKFEGGGIFSVLANALATPYGSEDEERMRKLRQMRGLLAPDESIAPKAAPRPTVTRGGGAGRAQVRPQTRPAQSMPFGSTPVGGGMPAAPSMTFGNIPVGGGMPAAPTASQGPSPQAGIPMPMGRPSPQEGMPIPSGADPEFAQFMERAKQDPMMYQFIDNADVMRNIFKMYKQQLSTGRMY
jgi:hypothetical protein